MKVAALKGRLRDAIVAKWRLAVGAPLKEVFVSKGENLSSLQSTTCPTKPNQALEKYFEANPLDGFVIKAHRPSPTTSVPQTTSTVATDSSLTVDTKNSQQKPKTLHLNAFKWKSLKLKLQFRTKKSITKAQPTPTINSATAATTSSTPPPTLTITVPEPLETHPAPLESPSERAIRVASTAINNLGRAFSSCLPFSSFTVETLSSPSTSPFSTSPNTNLGSSSQQATIETTTTKKTRVSRQLATLKSKAKNLKDILIRNNTRSATTNSSSSNFLFSSSTVDDMMDKMIDTINNATGRNKFRGPKLMKKLWRRASNWAGF